MNELKQLIENKSYFVDYYFRKIDKFNYIYPRVILLVNIDMIKDIEDQLNKLKIKFKSFKREVIYHVIIKDYLNVSILVRNFPVMKKDGDYSIISDMISEFERTNLIQLE